MTKPTSHRSKATISVNTTSTASQNAGQNVNTISYSTFQKLKGTEKIYQESIEASSTFNKRLLSERKMRMPFIDSQTRVAQSNNSMLWPAEYHRQVRVETVTSESESFGRVYSYPVKKWYKHRRLEMSSSLLSHLVAHRYQHASLYQYHYHAALGHGHHHNHHHHHNNHASESNLQHLVNHNENSNSMDAMNSNGQHGQQATGASQSASAGAATAGVASSRVGDENLAASTLGSRSHSTNDFEMISAANHSNHEWASNHHSHHGGGGGGGGGASNAHHHNLTAYIDDSFNDQYDSFNDVHEVDSDDDSYEEPNKKKKKKGGKPRRKVETPLNGEEKPFVCDICGIKYKTKPGLTYHRKTHLKNKPSGVASTSNQQQAQQQHQHTPWNSSSVVSRSNDAILPDESTTNSMFESHGGAGAGYDDVNSTASSNMSHAATAQHSAAAATAAAAAANQTANKCGICLGNENEGRANLQNPQAPNEKFISCCDCSKVFHPSCLNFNQNMIASVKKYNWQCIECKRCTHCGNSENDDKLLFCDDCDRGFHMYCLKPPLNEAPQGDWRCELCVKQFGSA